VSFLFVLSPLFSGKLLKLNCVGCDLKIVNRASLFCLLSDARLVGSSTS
jgi:hypothetical protein